MRSWLAATPLASPSRTAPLLNSNPNWFFTARPTGNFKSYLVIACFMILEKSCVPDLNFFNFPRIGNIQCIARLTDEIHFFEIHIVIEVEFVIQQSGIVRNFTLLKCRKSVNTFFPGYL